MIRSLQKASNTTRKRNRQEANLDGDEVFQYSGRYRDRNELRKTFNDLLRRQKNPFQVTEGTHQAEHVIGYHILAPKLPREGTKKYKKLNDDDKRLARDTENNAPAYHEVFLMHRIHPGTGQGKRYDRYHADQRAALTDDRSDTRYSNAVQLN